MTDLRTRLQEFLRSHDTLTLATVGAAGEPQAAAVFYVADDELKLYYLSSPESRHSRNLVCEPRVAANVQEQGQDWETITGVQIEGTAALVEGTDEIARAARMFAERYEFLRDLLEEPEANAPSALRGPLRASRFYVLRPSWLRLIDNRQGFGHKEELVLE